MFRIFLKELFKTAFIFYIKINEVGRVRLNDYKITGKYGLTDNIFEIIVCRLCEYYMQRTLIVPVGSTDYDHDILSCNGGKYNKVYNRLRIKYNLTYGE